MEQHAPWTETVRDIILSPLKCCLVNESSDEDELHPLSDQECSMTEMPISLSTSITETTRLLDQSHYQCYGLGQAELEQTPNRSKSPLITDAPNIIAAPKPVPIFPLFEDFDSRGYWDGGDADATDDQDDQTDPFEYDNAPEYREILGHSVRTLPTTHSTVLPIELDEIAVKKDLLTLRRTLKLEMRSSRAEGIETVESLQP